MTKSAALIFAAFLALPAAAQQGSMHYLPEPDFDGIISRVVEPLKAKDAFKDVEACAVVDAKTFAPVTLAKAEQMLAPCMAALSKRYQSEIKVGRLSIPQNGELSTQVEGLAIYVPEEMPVTGALMKDLGHGLTLRKSRILGHPAVLRRGALPTANKPGKDFGPKVSIAQQAIDRCVLTTELRSIETSEDFLKYYGGCLRQAPELKVQELRPAGQKLTVAVLSFADEQVAQSLIGRVSVISADGPVSVSLVAFPQVVSLPY